MNIEKSEQIKAGLQKSFKSGKSAKASTACYGYKVTSDGELLIYPTEAIIVIHIFDRFAAGDSLGKISVFEVMWVMPDGEKRYTDGFKEYIVK